MQATKCLAAVLVASAVALVPAPALADGYGDVNCNLNPNNPQCNIVVIDPGHDGNDSGGGGSQTCRLAGEVVPCYAEEFGWLGRDGCYYGKDGGGFLPANEYIKTYYDPASGNLVFGGTARLDAPPATLAGMIQRAVSQLK